MAIGITSAISWAIFGIIWVIIRASFDGFSPDLIGVYLVGILAYPLIAGFGAVVSAWIYNLAARRFGGLEVELKKVKTRR
jgi:hypothetical protein